MFSFYNGKQMALEKSILKSVASKNFNLYCDFSVEEHTSFGLSPSLTFNTTINVKTNVYLKSQVLTLTSK